MTQLSDKAMLVSLNITGWSGRALDKTASAETINNHNAQADAGRFNKSLASKDDLAAINSAAGDARLYHRGKTLPWLNDGTRLLPAALYFEWIAEMRQHRQRHETAVADFIARYPRMITAAQVRLGTLFRADEYPAVDQLARQFGFEYPVQPLADPTDFRVALGADEEARIRQEYDALAQTGINAGLADIHKRVRETVGRMAERLAAYHVDAEGRTQGKFHDTLVTNVRDLVDVMAALNINNDPEIERIRRQMAATLTAHDPTTLRN